jgi:hypothetical protein
MLMANQVFDVAKKQSGGPPRGGRKETRFEMRAEQDWLDRVERQASRFGLTVAAYIRLAASERVERDEASDPSLKGD